MVSNMRCRIPRAVAHAAGCNRRCIAFQRSNSLSSQAFQRILPEPQKRASSSVAALPNAVDSTRAAQPGLQPEPWTGAPEQEKALLELRRRMASSPHGVPSEDTLRWYLRDRSFDVDEAEAKLSKMLRWRQDFLPGSITQEMVAKEFASGKAYIHDHPDVYGRPAIVIRTQRHVTGEYPLLDSKRLCVMLLDEAISRLALDSSSSSSNGANGNGEQIVGIFDLRGFAVPRNADFVFAAFMIEAFFEYYPKRVGQVLMVEAPWVFGPAWEVIRPLMRKYAALVRFVTVKELRQEFFTPETTPTDFL